MKKYLSGLGRSIVVGTLLAGSAGVGSAIASPNSLTREIVANIAQRARFPILIPDIAKGGDETLYPYTEASSENSYQITFGTQPSCSANACFRFSIKGTVGGKFNRTSPDSKAKIRDITLAGGTKAVFTQQCGTACWNIVQWKSGNNLYEVWYKGNRSSTAAVDLANSAIKTGDRNRKGK